MGIKPLTDSRNNVPIKCIWQLAQRPAAQHQEAQEWHPVWSATIVQVPG